jgi:hypothetical protein
MKIFGQEIAGAANPEILEYGINSNGMIIELYDTLAGNSGLVDVGNTISNYDTTEDTYGMGIIQTNQLYESTTAITSIKVNENTNSKVGTRGTVDVSFDNGSSWSTASNDIGTEITDFTGTSDDSGTYKLKLKMTLGSDYLESSGFVWASTSALNTARATLAGFGTTFASLCVAGHSGALTNKNEIWNGSSWATTSNYSISVYALFGCGTTSDGLGFGGYPSSPGTAATYIWGGSSWATTTALTAYRYFHAGCGTTLAALCFGGDLAAGTYSNTTEKWGGSSWVTTSAMVSGQSYPAGCGTTSNALTCGGESGVNLRNTRTQIWNGSTWASTSSSSQNKRSGFNVGTTSAALYFGGWSNGFTDRTEIWSGSSWSTTTSYITSRYELSGSGNASAALNFAGNQTPDYSKSNLTQLWLGLGKQKGFSVKIN